MKRLALAVVILCAAFVTVADARPSKWCGWFARTLAAVDPGPSFNLACNWKGYGSATSRHEGAFVVWCSGRHHHVGKITGPCNGPMCVVTSGNDGRAVRTRLRDTSNAVAFRQ